MEKAEIVCSRCGAEALHVAPSQCIEYQAGQVAALYKKLDGTNNVLVTHGKFMENLKGYAEATQNKAFDKFLAVDRVMTGQAEKVSKVEIKMLSLSAKVDRVAGRIADQETTQETEEVKTLGTAWVRQEEMDRAVMEARHDGYTRGYADATRRFRLAVRELVDNDSVESDGA